MYKVRWTVADTSPVTDDQQEEARALADEKKPKQTTRERGGRGRGHALGSNGRTFLGRCTDL